MKQCYAIALIALALGTGAQAQTVSRPTTPAGMPTDGGKYVLVSADNVTGYMSVTSWDGSFYFRGKDDSHYADYAFTAKKNADDTWSFVYEKADEADPEADPTVTYVGFLAGVSNLKWNSTTPSSWQLEQGDVPGFCRLKVADGANETLRGMCLHLNAGHEYFVISEPVCGGGWYPDYAGGGAFVEDEDPNKEYDENNTVIVGGKVYEKDETGRIKMLDATSENWAFIAAEDVPQHMALYSAYNAITKFEADYLGEATTDPDYEDGFRATLTAAAALYNATDFNWEEDPQVINAMIDGKANFYKAITQAEALEGADAVLEAAIANAKEAFKTATSASAVETAAETLASAVTTFQLGGGDITALGKNMSFEDLSAQDGTATTGIGAPPAGWNVYINGKQVYTADDVKSAGLANWHGVNSECGGEGKDGQYGYGIWAGSIPTFEVSQTIEGLENGTYTITAGLMVGANGNGSRRATQRIFGNLNSAYYAGEADYDLDLLDPTEVYSFNNLTERQTETDMDPVSVRAYVYDGTLTFGLRTDGNYRAALRESANSAGGDGWFKLDNFRIKKEGYFGEDAAAVANHFLSAFTAYADKQMNKDLYDEVMDAVNKAGEVTAETPEADIDNVIVTLSSRIGDVKACVEAYERLYSTIEDYYNKSDEHADKKDYLSFISVLQEYEEGIDEGTLTTEDAAAALGRISAAFVDLVASGIAVGDYIELIQNPSFEDLSAQGGNSSDGTQPAPAGWSLYIDSERAERVPGVGWSAINGGDNLVNDSYPEGRADEAGELWTNQYTDGTHLWGVWGDDVPTIELSQTFHNIPAGVYTLSCDMVVNHDWQAGNCITTQRIFANNYVTMYGTEAMYAEALNDTPDMATARAKDQWNESDMKFLNYAGWENAEKSATFCPHHIELKFVVDETGDLTLGFRTNNVTPDGQVHPYSSAGWFKIDNFKLFFESVGVPTGIGTTKAAEQAGTAASVQCYSISGERVAQPQRGITIVKSTMSDGSVKTTKVLK